LQVYCQMKKILKISIVCLVVLLFGCKDSQKKKEIVNTGSDTFWGHRYSLSTDINYGTSNEQKLDIYSQGQWVGEPDYWKSDTIVHPTLIYIHGGGWLGGTKGQITPFIIPYLERGWNVITLDYRTGEGTAPLAIDDCMMALKWVAAHAKAYNVDTQHVVVSGESAGGHLALISGFLNSIPGSHKYYSGDSLKIRAVVNWFGITDIKGVDKFFKQKGEDSNYASIWVGDPKRMDSISKSFSPVNRITSSSPPVITIHGQHDSVVPYELAVTFHELLNEAGIKNELVLIPAGKHLGFTDKEFQYVYSRIFDFLDKLK
jgi:acetyl esterase/lipase